MWFQYSWFLSECLSMWPIPWDNTSEADIMASQLHHHKLSRIFWKVNYHFWHRILEVKSKLPAKWISIFFCYSKLPHLLSGVLPYFFLLWEGNMRIFSFSSFTSSCQDLHLGLFSHVSPSKVVYSDIYPNVNIS